MHFARLSSVIPYSLFVAASGATLGCALNATPTRRRTRGRLRQELSKKQTLLSAEEFKKLETNLKKAIAETQAEITKLEAQIATTEAANRAALAQINLAASPDPSAAK